MPAWLDAALQYIPRWLEFQMRLHEQPGCVIAIAYRGELVHEQAFGPLTPRHRFRVASHSKSFTAAGLLKLVERGRLRLNDPAGRYVGGLHAAIARATLAELLSHRAGVVRDGPDVGQFVDRRAFLNADELRAQLAKPPVLARNRRFKYSNHGYALLGLVIEAVTGEPYREWIAREIVAAADLRETTPDMPRARNVPFARGHTRSCRPDGAPSPATSTRTPLRRPAASSPPLRISCASTRNLTQPRGRASFRCRADAR